MASRLLLLRPLNPLTLGLGVSSVYAAHTLLYPSRSQLLHCDSGAAILGSSSSSSSSDWSYKRDAKVPVVKKGKVNPAVFKQVSGGSILGLVGGLAVSLFSKPLAVLLGLLVFGVQFAASRGFNIIPYKRMQRYASGIDLRSAVEDNVAFKLSFGAVFALAAFAEF